MQHTLTKLWQWVVYPLPDAAPPAALLIRLVIGGVFVGDGLLKWLLPVTLGVGRFSALGIPAPALMTPLVGGVELVGGLLFLLVWCTRLTAIPLLLDLVVAILATIIPQWLGTSRLPPLVLPSLGVPALLYDFRADVAQLLGTILLFFGGAGPWAVDALMARRRQGGGVQAEPAGALDGPVSRCGAMDVAPGLLRRTHIAIRTGDHGQGRPEYAGPRGQTQTEEAPMTPDATADAIAALVEGVRFRTRWSTIGRPWRGGNRCARSCCRPGRRWRSMSQ
jgi:putative oxidoreductase